jgi:isoaspartyl peptidase/L-asparaginase-like protein (Ntn-hydrolase superfamily)
VSGTGWGEAFMRVALAHEVSARMRHRDESLVQASRGALKSLTRVKGDGGLIALDRRGNIAMPFNSEGMLRAASTPTAAASLRFTDDLDARHLQLPVAARLSSCRSRR